MSNGLFSSLRKKREIRLAKGMIPLVDYIHRDFIMRFPELSNQILERLLREDERNK